MKYEAKFTICGRVIQQPDYHTSTKGRKFAILYVEDPGADRMPGNTFRLSVFDEGLLQDVMPALRIGQNVMVRGRLSCTISEKGRSFVNLTAEQILQEPVGGTADREQTRENRQGQQPRRRSYSTQETRQERHQRAAAQDDEYDDDQPF